MATSSCSILDRLPREIRDLIWNEALFCSVIDVTPTANSPSHLTANSPTEPEAFCARKIQRPVGTPISSKATALLRTCRQIRFEATALFYAHNNFQFTIDEATLSLPARWLSSLPTEGRSRIRNLTILFKTGNEDLFSRLLKETTSFDSVNMSVFVNTPRMMREKNLKMVTNCLTELKNISNFKHSAINFQFDRQTAGDWEWVSFRTSWAKCLQGMDDTFKMPSAEEIGCESCRRIGCISRIACRCRCEGKFDDEALEA